jgi:hypothetical protein
MANPLTLYVPIKQDPITQAEAKLAYANFVSSVQHGLDGSHTTFDGPMNPYLKFFWNNGALQKVFSGLAAIALNPPNPPVTDLTGFENFINNNNLNNPSDLYGAYPQTVRQIQGAFPHTA